LDVIAIGFFLLALHPRRSFCLPPLLRKGTGAAPLGTFPGRSGALVACGRLRGRRVSDMREPLLPTRGATSGGGSQRFMGLPEAFVKRASLCSVYVLLSASGPILLDWVKGHHGGHFPFAVPALTFHAYALAALLGAGWTATHGPKGLRQLNRPDMLWRFCITTSLFTVGDILSFMSLQHLDVGTFSLVGKAFAIVLTVLLTRLVLNKRQTRLQYGLVVGVAAATISFCHSEVHARGLASAAHSVGSSASLPAMTPQAARWYLGLTLRSAAVACTSLAAVLQERLLTREPGIPFLLQQCWMGVGAMATSLFTLRCVHRLPTAKLFEGFGDWRVLVLLVMYVASGLSAGLMVKRLGAVAKALCVPIYLGGCYAYAVHTGSAALSIQVVLAWVVSTACILLYAVTKIGIGGTQGAAKDYPVD